MLAIDAAWRAQLQEVEALRGKQKAANTAMAALPKGSPEFIAKVGEMKAVSAQVKEREAQLKETEEKFRQAMLSIPNLPHASVPEGRTPEENVVFALHGAHERAAAARAAALGDSGIREAVRFCARREGHGRGFSVLRRRRRADRAGAAAFLFG